LGAARLSRDTGAFLSIPDTRSLPKTLWNRPSKLVGIDMNDALQLDLLRKEFPEFRNEYKQFPARPCGSAAGDHRNWWRLFFSAPKRSSREKQRLKLHLHRTVSQLQSSDILFIDSSHTVKIGGDANYLFLEVLPRLKPGVIVHVHDMFLPFEYRRDCVMEEFRFWTEQYLLQAFLSFNSEFEVLMANSYVAHRYMKELKATFANSPWWGGEAFGCAGD
jgi:hypothetical protein